MPRILLVFALFMGLIAGCADLGISLGSERPMRENDPNLGKAHVERAKFFWAQGERNKTIQEMEWALAADPYNYEAAFNLGLIYLDKGERVSARRIWENALEAMEDGDQKETYENARHAADLRAALAELDKAERQLGSPEAVLSGWQSERRESSGFIEESQSSSLPQGGVAPGQRSGGAAAGGGSAVFQAGLPADAARGVQTQSGGGRFIPKPYIPSPGDGKAAPRNRASASSSSKVSARAAECPPCAPQNSGQYAVQVSSNRGQQNAQADMKRLTAKGYQASIAANQTASGTWYVVWVGCCTPKEQAQKLAADLVKQGIAPRDARVAMPRK